jgi:hypothetical protein
MLYKHHLTEIDIVWVHKIIHNHINNLSKPHYNNNNNNNNNNTPSTDELVNV